MPLNRKRPPVTIQVPEVPRAVYDLSESGTFTEGNLEISRSGMRIAGARSAGTGGGVATADGTPGAGPPGDAATPRKSPRGLDDGSLGDEPRVGQAKPVGAPGEGGADGDGGKGEAPEERHAKGPPFAADCVVGDSDESKDAKERPNNDGDRGRTRLVDATRPTSDARDECERAEPVPGSSGACAASPYGHSVPDGSGAHGTEDSHDATGGATGWGSLCLDELAVVGACGKGSGGVVQKAVHVPTGAFLAVKIVQMNVQPEIRKRVIGELRALHSAESPYVVAYRGAFFGDGSVSIVLEYADGGSVAELTEKLGRVREPPLCEIARQTLLGLRYLHAEKKIIHRDVKPSNILLNTDGSVKIGDFGVSGRLADSVAKCDSWVGTVTYMSPERISGEAYAFDSDVWSLGLSLLECATGRFPYALEEHEENGERSNGPKTLGFWDVLDHVVREPAPTLPKFPPRVVVRASARRDAGDRRGSRRAAKETNAGEVSEDEEDAKRPPFSEAFREVIEACLQKRPERRATAEALLASAWLAGADVERGRAILAETVTRASRRSRH